MDLNKILEQKHVTVVDVRSKLEYLIGHAKGSVNIPLGQLSAHVDELRQVEGPVVVCCASGARSGQAKAMLEGAGLKQIYNAGPWTNAKMN